MYRLFVPSGSTSPLMYDWNCSSDKFRDSLFSFSTKSTTQHCKKVEAYNIRFSAHVTDNWDKKFHKVQNYLLMIFLNTDNQIFLSNFAFETSFSFYSLNWHIIHCMIMAYSIADIYLFFHIFHFKQCFKFQKIQCTTTTMDILFLNIIKIDTFDIHVVVTTQKLFRSSIFRSCFMGLHEVLFQNSSRLGLYVVVSFLACN